MQRSREVKDPFVRQLREARQGRLKVFLGMAAGVGKTVAMLREARRLRGEGIDVVVGFVETHGRAGTEAERMDLEVLPRARRDHRGTWLEELDLDAVLARRPELVVVDELAHTNADGSPHPKRYQDVEALLAAGISVLGAMNVQHLESLHDLVLRATGVDVRERVPDRFLRRADELVVIDLPPGELRQRLREGLVYPTYKVEQALGGFFREENLAALRQLVLRQAANEVEERSRAQLRPQRPGLGGPDEPLAADAERVMVCMSSQPSATARLLRHGARLAGGINSRWFVVYVRTAHESIERIDSVSLRALTDNIRMARELGAEVVRLEGDDVVAALATFARREAITHAVLGRTRLPVWRERLRGSLLDRFMRQVPHVDVLVVGVANETTPSVPDAP